MPIYEYACGACNHRLEKLQKFSDAPLADARRVGSPR
ncbi:zinc ribbon domain-containing protein [Serratia ureilytica]